MKIREFQDNDYAEFASWWEYHKIPVPQRHRLPALGAVAIADNKDDGETILAAGFCYLDAANPDGPDTGVAFLHNYAANPKNSTTTSREALMHVTCFLEDMAVQLGYNYIYGASRSPVMNEAAERLGYTVGPVQHWELRKIISSCQESEQPQP